MTETCGKVIARKTYNDHIIQLEQQDNGITCCTFGIKYHSGDFQNKHRVNMFFNERIRTGVPHYIVPNCGWGAGYKSYDKTLGYVYYDIIDGKKYVCSCKFVQTKDEGYTNKEIIEIASSAHVQLIMFLTSSVDKINDCRKLLQRLKKIDILNMSPKNEIILEKCEK